MPCGVAVDVHVVRLMQRQVEGQRRGCPRQGADRALAFCSGMAALSAVLRLVASGEHVVAGDDIYGGTSRLLAQVTLFAT